MSLRWVCFADGQLIYQRILCCDPMFSSITLKEICSTDPVCISQEASLAEAMELMAGRNISSVIVVEDNQPVGIFTERDALRIIPLGLNPRNMRVREAMSSPPVVAPTHLDFFEAYHLCARRNIRHLIVVDDAGSLYGIATDTDFMKILGVDVLSGQEKVENVMSYSHVALAQEANLNEAIALMVQFKLPVVVVVHAGKPVGILTERDLVRLGRGDTKGNTLLHQVMTSPVTSVTPERSIYFAIELMREQAIRTLVVVDDDGFFQGVLTEHDVVKKIESRYVSVLTSIIQRQEDDISRIRHELDEKHVLSAVLHESLGVGLVVADPVGKVHYMNPAAAGLFGLMPAEAPGMALDALFRSSGMHTSDLVPAFDAARRGACYEYDLAHHTEANAFELHVRIAPIQDMDGNILGLVQAIQDVTERNHSERKLKQAASIFENTIEGVIIADGEANILSVNPAFTRITGYEEHEVRGKNPRVLGSGRQDRAFYKQMWQALSSTGYWQGEIWNRHKNGKAYAEWLTINVIRDNAGEPKNFIAVFADITSSKKVHDEFEYLAHHDPLTKLPNRLLFNARLTHSLARAVRSGGLVAILMIDLDGFKLINDQLGHHSGDQVLEIVADRLSAHTRIEDTVARLGGDEFVVVLEDLGSEAIATSIARKLIQEISRPIALDGREVAVTASVGIAFSSTEEKNPKALLTTADVALYEAKKAGKNTLRIYAQ